MDPVTCPRCRTLIQPVDGSLRCPACGVRARTSITAKPNARRKSREIATRLPAPAMPPSDDPESELDRLTAGSRRRRHFNDHLAGGGDEADCERIGRMLMLLRLLPVVGGLLCVLLLPAVAIATFASLGRETDEFQYVLILALSMVSAPALCMGYLWMRSRWVDRDDEDTSC